MLFVVARIEDAPFELDAAADRITVTLPWGSLLRGLVLADPAVVGPLARLAKPGAGVETIISIEERDAAIGVAPADLERIAHRRAAFAAAGLVLENARAVTATDVASTTWGKRLGHARAARVVDLRRARDSRACL